MFTSDLTRLLRIWRQQQPALQPGPAFVHQLDGKAGKPPPQARQEIGREIAELARAGGVARDLVGLSETPR